MAILAPLVVLVVAMLVTALVGVQLAGAGAQLAAEHGRWSAAERQAVAALETYALTGDESAWTRFRQGVARSAMPDTALAHLPPYGQAITTWARAETEMLELRALGERLRDRAPADVSMAVAQIRSQQERLERFDEETTAQLQDAVEWWRLAAFTGVGLLLLASLLAGLRAARRLEPEPAGPDAEPEREHAHLTLHSIGDGVITTDDRERVQYMNAAAERLTGWKLEEARGRPIAEVCASQGEPPHETHGPQAPPRRAGTLRRRDGAAIPVHEHRAPLQDPSGSTTGSVRVLRDVTTERAFERELAHQATHDGLTACVNRVEFERQLTAALPPSDGAIPHALLYFDLDQFKTLNDTCGHSAGDALLQRFAMQVKSRLRETDTLARLGGDEFCALLRHCPMPEALELAEAIRAEVAEARFPWQGRSFLVTASIGVVGLDEHAVDPHEAIAAADHACYQSKEAGRNRVRLWRPDTRTQVARQTEAQWLARLNDALEDDRFHLVGQRLQPLAATGHPRMIEVLLRMEDERGTPIAPMAFIPAAERYGLMSRLDRWVIQQSAEILAGRGGARNEAPCLLINLSSASLGDTELPDFVAECLKRTGLAADRLGFEVSETLALTQLHRASAMFRALKTLGCRTVLDDFGGGTSAFVYLRDLSLDYLKIDGNLVSQMTRDPVLFAMVESIQHVARVMGLTTIAEWAEEPAQIDALTVIGAGFAQGYAVHRPEILEDCLRDQGTPTLEGPGPNATRARNSGPLRLVP